MLFTEMYTRLKSLFNLEANRINIPFSDISIRMQEFSSSDGFSSSDISDNKAAIPIYYPSPDNKISENYRFTYPVFVKGNQEKYNHPILLLHGLNERSWLKYLPWAYYLAEHTGRPVILFPIAFHINRSPLDWANPRAMLPLLNYRKKNQPAADSASFVNVALSERLSDDPLRFFTSGRQSAYDIIRLVGQIHNGGHPLFEKDGQTDIFAYSIGAFLSEIIMLANPDGLFSETRLFMFCGGSVFSAMNGISKLIMDKKAFDGIYKFYMHDIDQEMEHNRPLSDYLKSNSLGYSFHSMIDFKNHQRFRDQRFREMRKRISTITLKNDKVVPAKDTFYTLDGNAEMFDFPYEYTHETPFPVTNQTLVPLVDKAFESVFSRAAKFLC